MNDVPDHDVQPTPTVDKGFWDRHAKLSILLIAGVFYVVLIAMCLTVGLIIWQS